VVPEYTGNLLLQCYGGQKL